MGLSFSVPNGIKVPSSLVNIYKELKQDLGCSIPSHGNLEKWAFQVMLQIVAEFTSNCEFRPFFYCMFSLQMALDDLHSVVMLSLQLI